MYNYVKKYKFMFFYKKTYIKLSKKYNFEPVSKHWISIGKNGLKSIFLTLKGDQKYTEKYLSVYKQYLI